jgi:hypothetical protein
MSPFGARSESYVVRPPLASERSSRLPDGRLGLVLSTTNAWVATVVLGDVLGNRAIAAA